ncbi:ATP-binding protein [Sphaerisporangium corydalis]|uniref:ATP-binding protein n=1 Tax=Sphaerisporangium corydalis TaxID=1441875 RepID=A0ABV9E9C7_9ACTN|nr:AAA family ATPase [Sphaerisporangium corydalis]
MGNLPAEITSFVGRRFETTEVVRGLEESRLVTLTGVGGVGKTRLALRVARTLESRFPDGVWFVELSSLREPALLGHAVCSVLGVAQQAGRPQMAVLAEFLAGRRSLIVLDTCEHLVKGCAVLVDTLLRAAPGLRMLVTSRSVLGLPGESRFHVEPLPIEGRLHPGAPAGEGRERVSLAPSADGAVALFADRAASLVPGFVATPEVALLCQRLDGIPLAIELAAVRLRTLSVEQIMGRIDRRFDLLSSENRAGLSRHQTLRTTIGWSHELCEPLERLLWARLSVFAGDFDLEAAQAVCADTGTDAYTGLHGEHVEDTLIALVEKSIVLRVDTGRTVRFRMLDTVREYGADWLRELGRYEAARRRHRDHYLGLARRFDEAWFGPDQVAWYGRMSRELPNLRAALDFCLTDPAEHAVGLELAGRLAYFWMACGLISEGGHYLKRALALDPVPGASLSRALWACAWLSDLQGELDEANDLATECLSQAFAQGDRAAAGWGMAACANTGLHWGYVSDALAMYERARDTHQDGGDTGAGLAYALTGQAYALVLLGRPEQALSCLRQQRSLCGARGEIWLHSSGDWVRGLIELDRADFPLADRFARTSLRAKHLLHDSLGMVLVLVSLARSAAGLGDMERAAHLLGIGDLVERGSGLRLGPAEPGGLRGQAEWRARAVLGDRVYEAAYAWGRGLDLDTALAYALGDSDHGRDHGDDIGLPG